MFSELWWNQHGGSGYGGLTRACVMEMDWEEIDFHLRRIRERRTAEAQAIDRERQKGKRK